MLLSNGAMMAASGEVRSIAMALTREVQELGVPHSWSGPDGERFQLDWHDQVQARLIAAANKLDGIGFEDVKDFLNG